MSLVAWKKLPGAPDALPTAVMLAATASEGREMLGQFSPSSTEEFIESIMADGNLFYREAFEICSGEGRCHALQQADMAWEYALHLCFQQGLEQTRMARTILRNRIKISESMKRPFRRLAEALASDMRYHEFADNIERGEYWQALFWLAIELYFPHDAETFYREFNDLVESGGEKPGMQKRLYELRGQHG